MPRGYKIQKGINCCANCLFGGYIGGTDNKERLCICEIDGNCDLKDNDYYAIAVEPLGICDAYKIDK